MCVKSALCLAVFIPFASASAWIDTGHMLVDEIAWREVRPEVRRQIDKLLLNGGDEKTRDFLSAACWADDHKTAENGPWHYINIHFRTDGKPVTMKPLEQNVSWAIDRFTKILGNRGELESSRADALRFVLHFVGDVHQPMHSVARDTDEFPNGDRGGNDFTFDEFELGGFNVRNLHFLWDIAGGLYGKTERPLTNSSSLRRLADRLIEDNPRSSFATLWNQNVNDWVMESNKLAQSIAYDTPMKTKPSEYYLQAVRYVSARRLTLAGYRLADLLNKTLGQ